MVTRRRFTQAALGGGATRHLAALFAGPVAAPAETTGYARDALQHIPLEQVQLRGVMGAAIDRCIRNRILAQSPDALVEPFRHRNEQNCWQTEFWGKWFLSAASAYRYQQDAELRERLGRSVRSLLATQSPDGYIGNYADGLHLQHWDIWGRKYTLLGLLAWHEISADEETLSAAMRVADHLISEAGPGKADIVKTGAYRGMPSSSVLEPIVLLYRATKQPRYLQFAEYIVERWSSADGPHLIEMALAGVPVAERYPAIRNWWSWENGQKAYEMMSCYEGLLELYRVTGRSAYLSAVLKTVANIRETEINVAGSGASLECWYGGRARQVHPARHMMETCVTMTWMKLCDNLLRLTGDPAFADDIERSAYNALLSAMAPDGSSFAKYSPLEGARQLGEAQCGMGLNCCTANGPRGMMLLPGLAVMAGSSGPVVNFYSEGGARLAMASGEEVSIRQMTDYPRGGEVKLSIDPSRKSRFTLSLRIPAWSDRTVLSVNDRALDPPQPGTYARIDREWNAGDIVKLGLDFRGRIIRLVGDPGAHQAIRRGPVVLARDTRLPGEPVDEPLVPSTDQGGFVPLEPVTPKSSRIWMAFKTGFKKGPQDKHGEMVLCDYASAGNSWDAGSRFRVWLRQEYDPSRGTAG
jgi:DUF1680 family protein